MKDGKYVLVKDPNKALLRLYEVPVGTFEEDDAEDIEGTEAGGEEEKGLSGRQVYVPAAEIIFPTIVLSKNA